MKRRLVRITDILWLAPFISCIGGYLCVQIYFGVTTVAVPSLVGKQLHEAVCLLSDCTLTPRVIAHKENSDVPVGTILQQKPEPNTRIRSHQPIMLTLSQAPKSLIAPLVVGRCITTIMPDILAQGIRVQVYDLEADIPQDTCLAQWPSANQIIEHDKTMILYRAVSESKSYVMPALYGTTLAYTQELCEHYPITCQIIHTHQQPPGHTCEQCLVIDQRPLPGTLITFSQTKKMIVQLQV